jgi:outer membrane biosynthesis protein TonB
LKTITVAILLIASVPANYFAFDFASKNIDKIPNSYLPELPELSKFTKSVEYCSGQTKEEAIPKRNQKPKSFNQSSIMEKQSSIMQRHNQGIESANSQIQRQVGAGEQVERTTTDIQKESPFPSVVRNKVESEWKKLLNIHEMTKRSYGNCSATIQIALHPNGDLKMVNISKSSGDDKFDDIAFLAFLHTDFKQDFNKLSQAEKRIFQQFSFEITFNN